MSDRASATCIGDDIIRVNDSTIGPGPAEGLEHTGAHEMLHLLGMSHGGNHDGFLREADVAQVPTKSSSCNTNAQLDSYLGLSADDIGLLSFHHDPASEGQLVADSGFEFGYDVWERLDTPTFDRVNIAGASGQYRQKIKNNAYKFATSYAQQKIGLLTGDDTYQFRGRAMVGRRSSSYDLDAGIWLFGRTVEFDGNNICEYQDPQLNATNPNDPTPTYTSNWVIRKSVYANQLPTGWQPMQTPWWTAPAAGQIDLAVRISGISESSGGASTYYWLDNFSVELNQ